MPYYDYECPVCECRFEVRLEIDDKSLIRCPKCKTVANRLIPAIPHVWKEGQKPQGS
jgi:putative FmdB family regulatory protein